MNLHFRKKIIFKKYDTDLEKYFQPGKSKFLILKVAVPKVASKKSVDCVIGKFFGDAIFWLVCEFGEIPVCLLSDLRTSAQNTKSLFV